MLKSCFAIFSIIDFQMSSSVGVVVKICEHCPNPLSLYCTVCQRGLCSSCLARHLGTATDRGHYVCFYRDRMSSESIGKYCRNHAANICDYFCISCFKNVCFECLNDELHHTTMDIQALMRQNLKQVQDDMQMLSTILTHKYDAIKETIDSLIEEQTGKINMVPHILARSFNLQSHSRLFYYECRKFPNPFLDEINAYLRRVGSILPPELILISFRVELRKHIIDRMLVKLAERLMNHRFLQKSRLRSKRCLILTKLSDSDFFEEANSVVKCNLARPSSATNKANNAKKYPKRFPPPKLETVFRLDRSEKEETIDDVYNDSSHFVVNNGPVLVITVLAFAHGGKSRMHGIVFQNAHGEVVLDAVTETITQRGSLHCVVASTSNKRHLLAASDVLIEIKLMEKSIKRIRKQDKWKYVDMTCTFSGFLLVIEEGNQLQSHQQEYRVTRCDLNGNILQQIDFDTDFLDYPFKIQERINGDIAVLDKSKGDVLVLSASGQVEQSYCAENAPQFLPHLILCDKFGNTIIYDKERSTIQITGKDLRNVCKIQLKKNALLGFCIDIDDRLVCLCRCKDSGFEIQIYKYMHM